MTKAVNFTQGVCLHQPIKGEQAVIAAEQALHISKQIEQNSCEIFPGIILIYNDVHTQELTDIVPQSSNPCVYVIHHCRQGRVEASAQGQFFYLDPGDIAIHKRGDRASSFYFPTGSYEGVSIRIDVEQAPKCFSCLLDDVNVQPGLLLRKFCAEDGLFIARSSERLEHVFSELYRIPEEVRKGYLKIKIMEIFLFLSCFPSQISEERKQYSLVQAELGMKVARYLTDHITEPAPTMQELSQLFHASASQLKNSFKGIYGVSVPHYVRSCKMKSAAGVLLSTDKTVLDIANQYGYGNASKFAKAFAAVMGMPPAEYRKVHLPASTYTSILEP